ncbi:UspA [Dillenia turbinata]|uniref:UspA n=1 Tax=Dillenia turbinata TaxID=194707 RepID=A0AAN8VVL3_9MAGN
MEEMRERKIVVAVDESEESMYALSWCLSNLQVHDPKTTLVLLYVKPPPPAYSSLDTAGFLFPDDLLATMEKYSKKLVDSVMHKAEAIYRDFGVDVCIYLSLSLSLHIFEIKFHTDTQVKVEKKVGSGNAKDVICGTVNKLGADILVMGTHGYGFFKRALLGSVSDYCSKHVKCPVLVVKRPKNN